MIWAWIIRNAPGVETSHFLIMSTPGSDSAFSGSSKQNAIMYFIERIGMLYAGEKNYW